MTRLHGWQVRDGAAYVDWLAEDGSLLQSVVVLVGADDDEITVAHVAPPDERRDVLRIDIDGCQIIDRAVAS